jgi:hypothetical protein
VTRGPDIAELVRQGVALVVATRDVDLRPTVTRGWGPSLSDDGRELMLCVEAPPGSPTRDNLAAGVPLAANLSRPSTYSAVQLKGTVRDVRAPDAGDLDRVAAHVDAFVVEVAGLGMDPDAARRLAGGELLTVVVGVDERYDQTPGEGAGARL